MKILALDSSGLVATIAIIEEDNLIGEYTIHYKKTHSQTIVPMLDQLREMLQLDLQTLDAIAVSAGPGSFTGLRIGSAVAKGIGLSLNIPLISVPTIEALAYNCYGLDKVICPILDARRGQVYTGLYVFETMQEGKKVSHSLKTLLSQTAVLLEEVVVQINQLGKEVIFLGDGVPVFQEKIAEILEVPYFFAPAGWNRQRAASVGVLGMEYAKRGMMETASAHRPDYLRAPQAERERLEKEQRHTQD